MGHENHITEKKKRKTGPSVLTRSLFKINMFGDGLVHGYLHIEGVFTHSDPVPVTVPVKV